MSKVKDTKNKLRSRIDVIKKIDDNPKQYTDSLYDNYLNDLSSTDKFFGKKIDDFADKRRSKKDNNKDIFEELIDTVEGFVNIDNRGRNNSKDFGKNRIRQHAITSVTKTLDISRDIVNDAIKKAFFSADGICGTDQAIKYDTITLKPKEFDFLNVLTINPNEGIGNIIYEPEAPITNKIKFDRELYNQFTASGYTFGSINNNDLFNIKWDAANQYFVLTGLTNDVTNIGDFLDDYYNSIEFNGIEYTIKTAMLLTIQGDGSETTLFNQSLDELERLLKKLFSVCGSPTKKNKLQNQTPINLFDESDDDIEYYFNFDDVEGIDLETEEDRRKGVLKFKDCENFEVPKNTSIIEDFIYFSKTENANNLVIDTLNKTAIDAYEQSDSSISLENFKLSILNSYILNIPKALIYSVLSPKVFLPITTVYKMVKENLNEIDLRAMMKKLSNLFYTIISKLFWNFIKEFWKLIKIDLILFINKLVQAIIKKKYKRYVTIITALINLLTKIIDEGIDNCYDLYNTILSTINKALAAPSPFSIPGIILGLSDFLPGYSQDRALLNISERMESNGISLSPIYGEDNELISMIKSIVDGNTEELDTNSFISVTNKEMIIPSPVGPIIIPPGILGSVGKII